MTTLRTTITGLTLAGMVGCTLEPKLDSELHDVVDHIGYRIHADVSNLDVKSIEAIPAGTVTKARIQLNDPNGSIIDCTPYATVSYASGSKEHLLSVTCEAFRTDDGFIDRYNPNKSSYDNGVLQTWTIPSQRTGTESFTTATQQMGTEIVQYLSQKE